jgi:hypothetical protein
MKVYGESGGIDSVFFTSAVVGGEWSDSRRGRFTPGESAPSTHWMGRVGPQSLSGRRGEDKILDPTATLTPATLSRLPTGI